MNIFRRIQEWHRRHTSTKKPYMVYWNQYTDGSLYGWGRIRCNCKAFKTAGKRYRFCKKISRRYDFAGIVSLVYLKGESQK